MKTLVLQAAWQLSWEIYQSGNSESCSDPFWRGQEAAGISEKDNTTCLRDDVSNVRELCIDKVCTLHADTGS